MGRKSKNKIRTKVVYLDEYNNEYNTEREAIVSNAENRIAEIRNNAQQKLEEVVEKVFPDSRIFISDIVDRITKGKLPDLNKLYKTYLKEAEKQFDKDHPDFIWR